jgi:endonuclease YncB( thermonuclease family)
MSALLLCLVVAITDGDTLRARCDDRPVMTIRLAEIDAPEKAQAFGQVSRQHLSDMCFQKHAEVSPRATDRYGRTVARVNCNGVDANAGQVQAGMAWAFTKYLTDPAIRQLEDEARRTHRGLWADSAPVAPWEWRHVKAAAGPETASGLPPTE